MPLVRSVLFYDNHFNPIAQCIRRNCLSRSYILLSFQSVSLHRHWYHLYAFIDSLLFPFVALPSPLHPSLQCLAATASAVPAAAASRFCLSRSVPTECSLAATSRWGKPLQLRPDYSDGRIKVCRQIEQVRNRVGLSHMDFGTMDRWISRRWGREEGSEHKGRNNEKLPSKQRMGLGRADGRGNVGRWQSAVAWIIIAKSTTLQRFFTRGAYVRLYLRCVFPHLSGFFFSRPMKLHSNNML